MASLGLASTGGGLACIEHAASYALGARYGSSILRDPLMLAPHQNAPPAPFSAGITSRPTIFSLVYLNRQFAVASMGLASTGGGLACIEHAAPYALGARYGSSILRDPLALAPHQNAPPAPFSACITSRPRDFVLAFTTQPITVELGFFIHEWSSK